MTDGPNLRRLPARRPKGAFVDLMRRRLSAAIVGLVAAICLTIAVPPRPFLVWNASASAPIGLYVVSWNAPVISGETVIARVPQRFRKMASRRLYLPNEVPLVKRVAATPGDLICARGRGIYINGAWAAARFNTDASGRPMPWWQGCKRLRDGQLFLLSADAPTSFDGRYFGASQGSDVIGKARLVWPRS
jgi:conjugative transfer signal peptidase TraF